MQRTAGCTFARFATFFRARTLRTVGPMAKRSAATLKIRDEVAALKRERTLGAAVDLFYEKGYDNTTLDEVAERLGVTKPFIYANFGSKTELLKEICARGVRAAEEALDAVLAKRLSSRESLELF